MTQELKYEKLREEYEKIWKKSEFPLSFINYLIHLLHSQDKASSKSISDLGQHIASLQEQFAALKSSNSSTLKELKEVLHTNRRILNLRKTDAEYLKTQDERTKDLREEITVLKQACASESGELVRVRKELKQANDIVKNHGERNERLSSVNDDLGQINSELEEQIETIKQCLKAVL